MAAYNLRDTDGNGYGNSWYADPRVQTVDLRRPFLSGPLPQWPGRFVHWLAHSGYSADFYSDEDLDAVATGDRLASRYHLIVFAGHEEYVTQHVFSLVKRYRDLGGNLAFLSANNFYRRVVISPPWMTCIAQFRDLGEPEAGLVGVQYVDWWHRRYPSRPFVVRSVAAAPWLFRGTGLRPGDHFGRGYGIEIDARASSSPPGTRVIAALPSIFGARKDRADDVLPDPSRGQGVRGGRHVLRRSPVAGDRADALEPVGPPQTTLTLICTRCRRSRARSGA